MRRRFLWLGGSILGAAVLAASGCEHDVESSNTGPGESVAGEGGEAGRAVGSGGDEAGRAGVSGGAGGSAGQGGEGGSLMPDRSCSAGPFTSDACNTGERSFRERVPCPQTAEQAIHLFCARVGSFNGGEVSRSQTQCGQTMVVIDYGWVAEMFYFDSEGTPVAYDYGTDEAGDCATFGTFCPEDLARRVPLCVDGPMEGSAGAGGQAGAGGAGGNSG